MPLHFNSYIRSCAVLMIGLSSAAAMAGDNDRDICGAVNPILSVADFDGNGIVDQIDIKLITTAKKKELYFALYDVDTNGKIDDEDIRRASQQLGQFSQPIDRQLAYLFNRNKQLQLVKNTNEITAMGYMEIASSLAGHGEHWTDVIKPIEGDFLRPDGLNIPKTHDQVSGVFWGVNAEPVFEGGATDYPTPGGDWETQRVIAFAGNAPKLFASPDEMWHTHAGLCITVEQTSTGPDIVLNQYTTYSQCQERDSLVKDPETNANLWSNIWMLHAWIFDLNPNGIFAGTHPCVDPDSMPESEINGDREVPPFFDHHPM